ncbi:hypothetical protein ONS95_001623 [Cadophora gregata]|uniref:uncharacterized protein n=1 Tax=Cadophora gregata TaxID=51156 RepID=UPI0026DC4558|nr:uncharacterized protein ONS95_001623 [Cadophora gregata]KAK0111251.1 hypothetical protein ONS95_001623 [Cadophora gregata]
MCDSEGDEDTIVVRTESDMSSRRARKKLPQSGASDSTTTQVPSSKILHESRSPEPKVAPRDSKLEWSLKSHCHKYWPDEPRNFIWRYMHRNQLYSQHPPDEDVLILVHEINSHVGISLTDEQQRVVCENVKAFIVSWTNKWHSEGLLIECWHPNGLSYRRSPKFNSLLRLDAKADSIRIAPGHAGLATGLVTLEVSHHSPQKRDRQLTDESRPEKRRKYDHAKAIEREKSPPRAANRLQTPPGSAFGDASSTFESHFPCSTESETSESTSRSAPSSGWVAINDHISSFESIQPAISEEASRNTLVASSKASKTGEHMIPSLPTAIDQAPSRVSDSSSSSSETPTTSSPIDEPKVSVSLSPTILFIAQKRNLSFDFTHPLPSLRNLNIPDFFSLFSTRSGHSLSQLDTVTFDIIFAGRSKLVLRRDDSEVYWRSLKRRISLMFRDARRGVDERCWEVWVREGDFDQEESEGEEGGDDFEGL